MHTCLNKKLASVNKLKQYTRIRGATLNVRGFNKIATRQVATQLMKDQGYDIMLLTETDVNLNSWENGTVLFAFLVQEWTQRSERGKKRNARIAKQFHII